MTEFCFEPGLTEQEIAEALRKLPPDLPADAPVVAWGGAAGRAVFASGALLRLFAASNLDELSDRLFAASDPGSKRLASLAASLPLDGAPRVERLRFFLGPVPQSISFLCRRLAWKDGAPLFIAAALDLRDYAGGSSGPLRSVPPRPGARENAAEPLPELHRIEDVRARLARSPDDAGAIRFLWRTDAEDRIVEVTAPLAELVGGAAAADLVGRNLADAARSLDVVQGRRLAELMARRESWSGVEILWPIEGAVAVAPICFGGAPSFDSDRRFAGYRGFGVIYVERVAAAARGEPLSAAAEGPDGPHDHRLVADLRDEPPPAHRALEAAKVIPLRPLASGQNAAAPTRSDAATEASASPPRELTRDEQKAFSAIAFSLGAKLTDAAAGRAPREAGAFGVGETDGASRLQGLDAGRRVKVGPEGCGDPPANAQAAPGSETPIARFAEAAVDRAACFDGLPIGILVCCDQAPVFANRFLLNLVGYADLDLAAAAGAFEPIVESLRSPARQGEMLELRGGSGRPIFVRARFEMIEWGGQKATLANLLASAEAGDAELRHYKSEARELSAVLDTVMDGVLMLDAHGRILALNRSGEALFGYDKSEVAGKPFTVLIAPESRARAEDYFEGVKSNGVVSLLNDGREIMGLARQGGAIPMFMTLGRISAAAPAHSISISEQEVRFCALLRDITHWKKIERELDEARREAERASALKSDFLAKVSHEIRTPLNAIMGFAEVIMDERFGPIGNERYKDYLKDIHSSGALVMSLVNDLLDLSKIEAGKMELKFAPVDANRIISQCVSIMQPQASRARVVIRLALAAGLPHLLADERSLRQIVLNLLSNAVKFNQPGGQVIVATALTDAGHVALRIRDNGVGMSEADIEIALEPFRQLAVSSLPGGTGLGLPLTKAMVEANRAFFSIKSKKHEGTLVEVAFPPARVLAE